MGGTWWTQCAAETHCGLAIGGGEAKEAVPPMAQAEINSFTDAERKCVFNLDDMFEDIT